METCVKMCIQNLSWAPATASTRQSQSWIQRAFRGCWEERCVTHWLHHWSWTGSRCLQLMFIPSGFPSVTEKRQNFFLLTVENSKSLFVMFLTGKGSQTPHLLNQKTAPTGPNLRNLQWEIKKKIHILVCINWKFVMYFRNKICSTFTRS